MNAVRQVTIIPPKSQKNNSQFSTFNSQLKKRVAAYARVSTDAEEQLNSYEAQVKHYTKSINENPEWSFVAVYADEAKSGASTKKRDGFNKMIDDAMAGKVDYIVTKAISRFARNTLDCLNYVRQLKENGIGVYFEKENISTLDSKGEVLLTILASLAQDELRNISENVAWGLRKRMADGKVMIAYGNFLGYRRSASGTPEIVPEEAETVRLIYRLFLEGKTATYIKKDLETQCVKSPSGTDKWHISTVKSILQNEKYMGDALLQKSYISDFLTKKAVKNTGELPQYYIENSHPAIISKEVFNLAQLEFKNRTKEKTSAENRSASGTYSSKHTFSSKLVCGHCGGNFGSKVWHSNSKYKRTIWRCNEKYKTKGEKSCSTPHLDEKILCKAFIDMFNSIFEEKDTFISTLETILDEILNYNTFNKKLELLNAEELSLEALLKNLIDKNATTAMNQNEYNRQYSELENKYFDIKAHINKVHEQQYNLKLRTDSIKNILSSLKNQTETLTEFDSALWNAMVDTVTVVSDKKLIFRLKGGSELDWNI